MEITKGSDLILILKLEDFKGEKMRVADCADFRLYVWTANRNNFLQFTKKDITQDEKIDKIAIPDFMMNCLESGVICYQYRYSKYDGNFDMTDNYYDKSKICVTEIYWRNCNFNEEPANPVNYQTLNYLTNKIEKIALECENNHAQVKEWLDTEYMDKLNEEIKRSNEVDVEFHKLIKSNKEDCDNKATEINDKLDAEIKRSNDVDIEIFNLIKDNADSGKETTDAITDKLDAEIARSSQKDADLENALNNEVARATNAETILDTKLEGEIERAKTAEGAIRDAVENERDRAITKETLINDSLTSEIARSKQVDADITASLQTLKTVVEEEKQRSADKDTEHTNSVNQLTAKIETEIQRATDREEHINDDLHAEIARAKAEEARIEALVADNNSKDNELKEAVNAEIERAKQAEKDLFDTIDSEITRSVNKDAELSDLIADNSTSIANEIQRATDAEKTITDALNAEITRSSDADTKLTSDLTNEVSRATAKETEIENKVAANTSDISDEVTRATGAEKVIADNLTAEISRAKGEEDAIKTLISSNAEADNNLKNDLVAEIARAKAEEARIENITSVNAENISSEIARAKQVEADITTSLQQLKTSVQTKDSELTDSVNDLQTALQSEVSRSTSKDTEIDNKLSIINGGEAVVGSIAHSLSDAKHYTDDEIAKLKSSVGSDMESTLADYATKTEVDTRIKEVIGTAPEALDTLGEIANVLNGNGDAIEAINGVLAGKANSADVYTKAEVDSKVKNVSDNLTAEVTRATSKENELNILISSEVARSTAKDTEIESDLNTEVTRAKAAEKANADAIAKLNGGEEVIGSVAHGVADAKHYTDDEIAKLKTEQNIALANFATKNEVNAVDGKLSAHVAEAEATFANKVEVDNKLSTKADTAMLDNYATKVALQGVADMATKNANDIDTINEALPLKADKSDVYTKTEVDNLIDNVDVTEQLKDYAKTAETTCIKDENGNIITEMVIDNSAEDDTVEVYTKEQCDERFAKLWTGTQAQYDAIVTKDINTLYVIL